MNILMESSVSSSSSYSSHGTKRNRLESQVWGRFEPFLLLMFLVVITGITFSITASSSSRTTAAVAPPPSFPVVAAAEEGEEQDSFKKLESIKNACANTPYPSLCFRTLNTTAAATTKDDHLLLLQPSIRKTIRKAIVARARIGKKMKMMIDSGGCDQKDVLDNCMEMLDQTLYQLKEAIALLHPPRHSDDQTYLKTLLSAAMTNQNTCLDGFSDDDPRHRENSIHEYLEKSLTPILNMIGNSLSIIRYLEENTTQNRAILRFPRSMLQANKRHKIHRHILSWMTSGDKAMMGSGPGRSVAALANVVVALDGSGNFTKISDAVRMAPNMSSTRYVIRIKAGIYNENVMVPRYKANLMLIGDGMNSTVITGSRNVVGGFSTFNSATLIVVGNKFLARDLTIVNTSGPEKHQAVALRVTSNAAFYRCQFVSYQDTLYAHSLSQLYRECVIQGSIDFIFGNAAAIFQKCLILVRRPNPGQKNVITAQGRTDPNQNTGISLQDCTVMAAPDFPRNERRNFSTFLGRPWRNYSRTVVTRSYLANLIDPRGWCRWDEYSNLNTVEYIEFMNYGPGADTRRRVKWGGYWSNFSSEVDGAFLHEADDWLSSTDFPLHSGPYARDSLKQTAY